LQTFKAFISEKKIFDYLLDMPKGEELDIATEISKMGSSSRCVYRGMCTKEYKNLIKDKIIVSKGVGNTRDIIGSYVATDIQLAGRFALRAWKDGLGGVILTFDREKLPHLNQADPGNYYVDFLAAKAIRGVYILGR